ncbi:AEC family transporter [Paenibacillus sp. Marseille-Q4541]|uniref:AEC family transporter n=1 Tax=Paenibacillus sp. Marseille-Q4541 TaxID=2831522 RepID=UPI001BABE3FC|nr:AEC family transporter [Paenibacillus sp. Marseille-Q4541]
MGLFLSILLNNVIPLFLVMTIGFVVQRTRGLDIKTLSNINFYILSPAVVFNLLYTTDISMSLFGQVMAFFVLFMLMQYLLCWVVIKLLRLEGGMPAAMRNSVLFANSANYGLPINELAFSGNPLTLGVQVIILMLQSFLPNTYGIYSVNAHQVNRKAILRTIAGQPVIYAIPLAFLLRFLGVELPNTIQIPLNYLYAAFIGMALLTLGVQLGAMKWTFVKKGSLTVAISVFLRLIGGPLLAALTVILLGLDGLVAKALIVSSCVPTSLSSMILAVQFDNEPEFSSQAVFFSTLLSTLTVTGTIMLLNI